MRDETQRYFADQPGGLGDVWQAVGQIGAAAAQTSLNQLFGAGAGSGGQARGLAAINAFGEQVVQALNQILQAVQNGQVPPGQALSDAQTAAGYLGNPQHVYQAQRGNDAEALRGFKTQAANIVQRIQALAAPGTPSSAQTVTTINPLTGQPATAATPSTQAPVGAGSTTLLFAGAGLLALLLLKK